MIKDIDLLSSKDLSSNLSQDSIKILVQQIKNCPFITGVMVKAVTMAAADNKISHKLFRKPLGYIVTSVSTPAVIYLVSSDSNSITLRPSVSTVADIWIF